MPMWYLWVSNDCHMECHDLVSFPDPTLKEGRVWYTLSDFWGVQDVAYHVIGMTTHPFGMHGSTSIALTRMQSIQLEHSVT